MCLDMGLIGLGISLAGSVVSGIQANQTAEAEARAYERQAINETMASAYEKSRERHRQELQQAEARAQVGASGVALEGSPTEALVANAREGELDIQAINWNSRLRQNQLNDQAAISRWRGKQEMAGSFINGGAQLVSGLSNRQKRVSMGGSVFS